MSEQAPSAVRRDRASRLPAALRSMTLSKPLHAQMPFILSLAVVGLVAGLGDLASVADPGFVVGAVIAVLVTVAAAAVPWHRVDGGWVALLPMLDFVALALCHDAIRAQVPSTSFLLVFPVVWLAYAFALHVLWLGAIGTAVVLALPFIRSGSLPSNTTEWSHLVVLPVVMLLVAVAVNLLAQQLFRQHARLEEIERELTATLDDLQQRNTIIDGVLDAIDDTVVVLDPTGRIMLRNRASVELMTLADPLDPADPIIGGLVYEEDRTTVVPPERQMVARARAGEAMARQVYWVGDGGAQKAVLASVSPLVAADGRSLGMVVVSTDVTALALAVTEREEFVASVSHELKTPLTSILGYIELIADDLVEDDLEDRITAARLAIVERNAQRLLGLIGDLLTAAQHRLAVNRNLVDVGEIVENALDVIRPHARSSGVALVEPEYEELVAEVDAVRIGQVLDNLLSNAVKYTPEGGTVTTEVGVEGDQLHLCVSDDGVGMSEDDTAQLFTRFFRTSSARASTVAGVGLGLSITRSIVDAHDGRIEVESAVGVGTTMRVRIPLRVRPPAPGS
ncbi:MULTISPECIES: sensor histidine kinase [Clavibacter]|uniref:histidine kinase n=1 Tax=Clavibacter tessellarius TaxID=31965 RepID=A0A154V4L7_9MICO|nr:MULTISPECIES: PAS domain-containing sensor histidine kinase [Clavibacter]KZC96312.1 PAS domain-containing sensor histidine kinase [Clavibacter michiganensis subsp. tessellarius]MDA3804572.1 ATP-binding protein [Clavibacter sp. CT19]